MFINRKQNKRSSHSLGRMETLETRKLMYGADCIALAPVSAAYLEETAIVAPAPDTESDETEQAKAKKKKDRWAEIVEIVDKDLEEHTVWTIRT